MKQLRFYLLIVFSIFLSLYVYSQENVKVKKIEFKTDNTEGLNEAWKSIKQGDKYFKEGKGTYRDARNQYLSANEYNTENAELNYKIGICYLFSDDKFESQSYLEKAFVLKEDVAEDIRFMLGKAYHLTLEFDNALQQYQEYLENLNPKQLAIERNTVNKLIQECRNGKELVAEPQRVIINNLGGEVNSIGDDYNSIFAPGDTAMYFTSRRQHYKKAKRSPIDNKYFEEVYTASRIGEDWDSARFMGKPVSVKNHNTAAVGLSLDGSILYVYQGHKDGGAIYQSEWKKGKWTSLKSFGSKFKSKWRETTVSISPDGKSLFFVSDNEKETLGGRDIFISKLNATGRWEKPENIGNDLNTPYDEEAVFISPDGNALYFSSRGHNTMGGYDVFRSDRNDLGEWSFPVNLGYPVNSPDDDLFYKLTPDSRYAYYSANRMGGLGGKDLYRILYLGEEKEMLMSTEDVLIAGIIEEKKNGFFTPSLAVDIDTSFIVTGKIFDVKTSAGIQAKIDFIDVDASKVVATSVSSDSGMYRASLPEGKAYGVEIVARDYLFFLDIVDISSDNQDDEINKDFGLEKVEVGATVVLENIFFETGKATLKPESFPQLEQVLKFLDSNPTIRMEISGHTDNTGSLKVNTRISQARAESVVEYLSEHGIDAGRLDAMGYAFSQPISPNDTPEGRARNRRVEFKILSK
jgi:tetratricopeptide (TPR) repeat protein